MYCRLYDSNNSMNFKCLIKGHIWKALVIPENDWGDQRYTGKICHRCNLIKELVPNPINLKDFDIQNKGD